MMFLVILENFITGDIFLKNALLAKMLVSRFGSENPFLCPYWLSWEILTTKSPKVAARTKSELSPSSERVGRAVDTSFRPSAVV